MKYYFLAIAVLSLISFILYGIDKRKAKKKKWRIKEFTLLILSPFGAAFGALIGMKVFHHKTKHWYFWAINIACAVLHLGFIVYYYFFR